MIAGSVQRIDASGSISTGLYITEQETRTVRPRRLRASAASTVAKDPVFDRLGYYSNHDRSTFPSRMGRGRFLEQTLPCLAGGGGRRASRLRAGGSHPASVLSPDRVLRHHRDSAAGFRRRLLCAPGSLLARTHAPVLVAHCAGNCLMAFLSVDLGLF